MVVIVVLRLHLMTRERGRIARTMRLLATTDDLTGVPNRRVFSERLAVAVEDAVAGGPSVGLLMIDVDRFKLLNDGYGHPVGDDVLRQASARIAAAIRPGDTFARIGGEEFALLAPHATPEALVEIAERCRRVIAEAPFVVGEASIAVTISAGGACAPAHARHADELTRIADRRLYEAKDAGRNRVHLGLGGAPQVSVPMLASGIVEHFERLADHLDDEQAAQEHSTAMLRLSARLCEMLGVTVAQRRRCLAAARLHDIGKVGTPLHILRKPGPLTADELAIMRDHVRVGVELLEASPETHELAGIVGEHHERFDGGGYPAAKRGRRISIEARIIAVADAWTAMLADRPYRQALPHEQAVEELRRGAGSQFDPDVVTALLGVPRLRRSGARSRRPAPGRLTHAPSGVSPGSARLRARRSACSRRCPARRSTRPARPGRRCAGRCSPPARRARATAGCRWR